MIEEHHEADEEENQTNGHEELFAVMTGHAVFTAAVTCCGRPRTPSLGVGSRWQGATEHPFDQHLELRAPALAAADDPTGVESIGVRGARPGRHAGWAWRWSFEQLREALEALLNGRRVPMLEGPLAESKLWTTATALLDLSFLHDDPIPIGPLVRAIPVDADIVINTKGRHVATASW